MMRLILSMTFILCFAVPVAGQDASTVTASGSAVVKQMPERLRMVVQIQAKGSTIEAALQSLKERRKTAENRLKELEAIDESIEFGPPQRSVAFSQQQREMMEMLQRQLQGRGEIAERMLKANPSVVSLTLRADWALEAETPEDLLLASHRLTEKIRAADPASTEEAQQLTPEEEEVLEELAGLTSDYGYETESDAVEPRWLYVATISAAQRKQALAEAFEKAKQEATLLAEAAGAYLGPIVSLGSMHSGNETFDEYGYGHSPYSYRMAQMQMQMAASVNENEAIATEPGEVTFTVQINADFRLFDGGPPASEVRSPDE